MIVTFSLFTFLGCMDKPVETASDTSSNSEETGLVPAVIEEDPSPSIISADFWCYTAEIGESVDQWILNAEATDPQGVDTIKGYIPGAGSFQIISGGEIASLAIVCTSEGLCTSSATGATIGASCSQANQFQIEFYIEDEDGNTSEPLIIVGRLGNSAQG